MLKKYCNKFISAVSNRKLLSVLYVLFYIAGIILGAVLNNTEDLDIIDIVKNYQNITLGLYSSPFKLMFTRLINNFFYFAIVYFFCYKLYFCVFNLIVFMYRGIVLGGVALVFFEVLGIKGLILYIFLVIVQNVLVTFCLFYTTILICYIKKSCKNKYTDNIYIRCVFIGYGLSLFVVLYELLFLLLIIRPLNIYF